MTRKLLIVLILPVAAVIGCASEPLRRVEVWKQQTILDPPPSAETVSPQLVSPAGAEAVRIGEPG